MRRRCSAGPSRSRASCPACCCPRSWACSASGCSDCSSDGADPGKSRVLKTTVQTITAWHIGAVLALLSVGAAEAAEITVPAGFRVDVYAEKLGGARALAVDPEGVLLVSIASRGRVVALRDP